MIQDAIARCRYRDWEFEFIPAEPDAPMGAVRGSRTADWLIVKASVSDSHTELSRVIRHTFEVPAHVPDDDWELWLCERVCDVEKHEAMERFEVARERPFFPPHVEGANYYAVRRRR